MFTHAQQLSAKPSRRPSAAPSYASAAPPGRRLARSSCACGGGCPSCSSKRLAREGDAPAEAEGKQAAPVAGPEPPEFRDCSLRNTGIDDANQRLETARQRARDYVGAARGVLGAAPAAGSVYATALARHFIAPSDAQRTAIDATYQQILGTLTVSNFICNSNNICEGEQAFWLPADDLIHVCRPFWELSPTCRAIILVHEGAHDAGISVVGAHAPNRGSAGYPTGNTAAPAGQTTGARMDNPDAYAFFAAHIWRNGDTGRSCF